MRIAIAFVLAGSVLGCAHSGRDFLPAPGPYVSQWTNDPACTLIVGAGENLRTIQYGVGSGPCSGVVQEMKLTALGIEEGNVVVLPAEPIVGKKWRVAGLESDRCHLMRRVAAVSASSVEVERFSVCDGVEVEDGVLSRWEVGRGRVLEKYPNGIAHTVRPQSTD
jgi:hypothetical protein